MVLYQLIQISDIHLAKAGSPGSVPSVARARDNLVAGLKLVDAAGIRPDVLVLTGDLTDAGDGACYDDLAAIIGEAAARHRAGVVYTPGNHDDRASFREHLLGHARDNTPVNLVHWREGLRIIALDSTVPGEAFGVLDDETLSFIARELATPAPDGTVVALHHPPFLSPIVPMARLALQNPDELREVITGSDVRVILCGHNHHVALGTLGLIPVWGSPATAYLADLTSTQHFQGVAGGAFSRIELTESSVTATVLPISVE